MCCHRFEVRVAQDGEPARVWTNSYLFALATMVWWMITAEGIPITFDHQTRSVWSWV